MKKLIKIASIFSVFVFILAAIRLPEAAAESKKFVQLPPPDTQGGKPLMAALKLRRSSRSFSPAKMPIDKLSSLLWAAQGVNRPDSALLTSPSAMNWQEIDVYVALPEGLYIYNKSDHSLSLVLAEDIREIVGSQEFTQVAPVGLIYVADYSKMSREDPEASFLAAADTGFVSQNVYLYCASEDLATVVLGWVDKPALAKKMGLREDQKIILTQPVGLPE